MSKERLIRLDDIEWLRQKYIVERLSTAWIGELLGCDPCTVGRALRRGGILARLRNEVHKYQPLDDVLWLQQKYNVEGLTMEQIGDILKCSTSTVYRALLHGGVDRRHSGVPRGSRYSVLSNEAWLRQEYEVKKQSVSKISTLVRYSSKTVVTALRHAHIHVRNRSEARRGPLSLLYGRKATARTREKMRIARRSRKFPKHHTKPELQFGTICTKNNLPFEFTGDGKVWIGKRGKQSINPDFTGKSNGKRFAVFVNGDYWHSQLLRPQLSVTQRPEFQISHSKKHRWVPIILWETDLKRDDAEAFVLATLEKVGFSVPR